MTHDSHAIREQVRAGYGKIAREGSSCCGPATGNAPKGGGCCGPAAPDALAKNFGYSVADLADLPAGANLGLSCGHPTAIAALQPGDQVLDLGCGGGIDMFIAGRKVGPSGHVIGVDMTADMLARARRNLAEYRRTSGLNNVEFRLGEIEHLPVADATIDVVISNCVLNLSPDKPQVWREISRVLKPGGRVAISDLALLKPLPDAAQNHLAALVGCISGAILASDTQHMAEAAGLRDLQLTPRPAYIAGLAQAEDPLYRELNAALPAGQTLADYITSLELAARK